MPDLNQLFDNFHIARMRALHASSAEQRDVDDARARHHATQLHARAYPQPGSFLPG